MPTQRRKGPPAVEPGGEATAGRQSRGDVPGSAKEESASPRRPPLPPKRKALWIDGPLQARIVGFVLALIVFALAMAYFGMDRGLEQAASDPRQLYVSVDWARQAMWPHFLLTGAIALTAGGVLAVIWSHRIIGPLMVLAAGLRRIRDGDLSGEERVRSTDAFHGFIEDLSGMRSAIRRRVAEDRRLLAGVEARLEALAAAEHLSRPSQEEVRGIREELKKITSSFNL